MGRQRTPPPRLVGAASTALAARISARNRRRKLRLFLETVRPDSSTRVVDVGVTDTAFGSEPGVAGTHNFFEAMYPWPERITAVSDRDLSRFQQAFPEVTCIVADGRDLPFAEDEFDVAFSNAVVEHVGDRRAQRDFVHELCRVAPRVFASTPNRWFPIESHTLVPLAHWLPRGPRERAFSALRRSEWEGVELLGPRDFVSLFPFSVRAHVVDVGMTTTVVAERARR
ncbi:MAG: class I SAM-dependent methyltransferase [Gaiellaceae bacterium]